MGGSGVQGVQYVGCMLQVVGCRVWGSGSKAVGFGRAWETRCWFSFLTNVVHAFFECRPRIASYLSPGFRVYGYLCMWSGCGGWVFGIGFDFGGLGVWV